MAVVVWTSIGLFGDLLLIPLLERIRGLSYLRLSALILLLLYPAFLLLPNITLKFLLLGLLGIFNAGWYSILKAQLYSSLPGQSGTVLTITSLCGLFDALVPLVLGTLAQFFGLSIMMWLLLFGPLALLIAIPKKERLVR
jgi:MFS transporter, FSR family, fosmidomycin resistance protein